MTSNALTFFGGNDAGEIIFSRKGESFKLKRGVKTGAPVVCPLDTMNFSDDAFDWALDMSTALRKSGLNELTDAYEYIAAIARSLDILDAKLAPADVTVDDPKCPRCGSIYHTSC